MILLDTNVVSEAIKPEPHPSVLAWLDAQAAETLFISSITLAELLFGIGALPDGKRKDMLAARIDGLLDQFVGRVVHFDIPAGAALCRSRRQGARGRKRLPHARRLYRRDRRRPRVRRRVARHACVQCRGSDGDRSLDRDGLMECRAEPDLAHYGAVTVMRAKWLATVECPSGFGET